MLLNHGYRVASTASSDACFDRSGGAIPGVVRTYTYLGEPFSLPAVTRAVARGANFVTSGPLLLATVDRQPPGTSFQANGEQGSIEIETWASGTDPKGLTRIELLRNGRPVQTILFSSPVPYFQTNLALETQPPCWYCVRVVGGDLQRQRAISGAFFFEGQDFQPPAPVPVRVQVIVQDAQTGQKLPAFITELSFLGCQPQTGKRHSVPGEDLLVIPATVRLKADVPGYESQTKSPFLDNPPLRDFITGLGAEDLLKWETFERVRDLLGETALTFNLRKAAQ